MSKPSDTPFFVDHDHVFLGAGHDANGRKTWAVIALCSAMMTAEIIGGKIFGSLALVADGLHMSTHAGAMLIAALAYKYARKYANDRRFVFGTGKLGDLAGFTSALILAMIALLIGYEAVARLLSPVPISFGEAIPIAAVGLLVNILSVWLLSGGEHLGHSHDHGGDHAEHDHEEESQDFVTAAGVFSLSVFENGVPPVFRIASHNAGVSLSAQEVTVTTLRPNGTQDVYKFKEVSDYLESTVNIPEPHQFKALVTLPGRTHTLTFEEHDHGKGDGAVDAPDHNMRATYNHVIADSAVSLLAIIGLYLAKTFGWLWMDPVAGLVGALVIANWSYGLLRDTGAILVDMDVSEVMTNKVRTAIEATGDRLADLHVWRLGPSHFATIISVATNESARDPAFYHAVLKRIKGLSHISVEVHPGKRAAGGVDDESA
jgi:cation diffusion facilitator family transporter